MIILTQNAQLLNVQWILEFYITQNLEDDTYHIIAVRNDRKCDIAAYDTIDEAKNALRDFYIAVDNNNSTFSFIADNHFKM